MNFINQTKLNREEWESTEIPVSKSDKKILDMLKNHYYQSPNNEIENYITLLHYLKIDNTPENINEIDNIIYENILKSYILKIEEKYEKILPSLFLNKQVQEKETKKKKKKNLNKKTMMRINNTIKNLSITKDNNIIEFEILENIELLLKNYKNRKENNVKYYIYVLEKITYIYGGQINNVLYKKYINNYRPRLIKKLDYYSVIKNSKEYIYNTIKYNNIKLYEHQTKIIDFFNDKLLNIDNKNKPSLILYSAPTGMGKTMTPIGILNHYKIIFVCASRHVGITLARYMISMRKKVGFAFGCDSVEDIRIHNSAVSEYITKQIGNKIFKKIDHLNGTKVEIMISDIKSCEIAQLYMKSFEKDINKLILFWDESTIGLDTDENYLHEFIKKTWENLKIKNVILSSASLPKIEEIPNVIEKFKKIHNTNEIICKNITSCEIHNSVSLLNSCGNKVIPHILWKDDIKKIKEFIEFYTENRHLLKYIDLNSCIDLIINYMKNNKNELSEYLNNKFNNPIKINIYDIKDIYLYILKNIEEDELKILLNTLKVSNNSEDKQQMYLTSQDAQSITGGACIYICNEYEKVVKFLIKTSGIPRNILNDIENKINKNNEIEDEITKKTKDFEDIMANELEKVNKINNNNILPKAKKIKDEIEGLMKRINKVSLPDKYIPNTKSHYMLHNNNIDNIPNIHTSYITDDDVKKIMKLTDVSIELKILLLIGIGVINPTLNNKYQELIKEFTYDKKMYLILTYSDYIYGTNYQFNHGYIGKDIKDITQQKIIQAMGRIGRQEFSSDYTFRFRDNNIIEKIFLKDTNPIEIKNMNKFMG